MKKFIKILSASYALIAVVVIGVGLIGCDNASSPSPPPPGDQYYSVSGMITTADNGPITEIKINLTNAQGAQVGNAPGVNAGTYKISGVPTGTYTLKAVLDGYDDFSIVVNVADADTVQDINFGQPELYSLSGRIRTTPTAGNVAVAAISLKRSDNTDVGSLWHNGAEYSFTRVPLGTYTLSVTLNGYQPFEEKVAINSNISKNINLIDNNAQTCTISGNITVSDPNEDDITGAAISLIDPDGYAMGNVTVNVSAKTYEITGVLAPWTYILNMTVHGYNDYSESVTVSDNTTYNITLTPSPRFTVMGNIQVSTEIVGSSGGAGISKTVTTLTAVNGKVYEGTNQSNGYGTYSYVLNNIPEGTYTFTAELTDYHTITATLVVDAAAARTGNTLNNPITFRPIDYSFTLSPIGSAYAFNSKAPGYTPSPVTITITNSGDYPTGALTITLVGEGAGNFQVSTDSLPSLQPAETATFTVQPVSGLVNGTYTATLKVTSEHKTVTSDMSFTVDGTIYTVSGSITNTSETINGRSFSLSSLSGVEVRLYPLSGEETKTIGGNPYAYVVSGGSSYSFSVPVGTYRLEAEDPTGLYDFVDNNVVVSENTTKNIDLTVFKGLKLYVRLADNSKNFILPVQPTAPNQPTPTINLSIDWGDGTTGTLNSVPSGNADTRCTHTYSTAGDWTIRLSGKCYRDKVYSSYYGNLAIAFGDFTSKVSTGYTSATNRNKLIKAAGNVSALTGTTLVNHEYGNLFCCCENLTDISGLLFTETTPQDYFMYGAFSYCISLKNLPKEIAPCASSAGNYFLFNAFHTDVELAAIPAGFLPANITAVGNYFLSAAFNGTAVTTIPSDFLPQGLAGVGDYFLYQTFYGCGELTSVPQDFLTRTSISSIGNYFLSETFSGCSALTGSAPALPSGLTGTAINGKTYFLSNAFADTGITSIPANWLPRDLTTVGSYFLSGTFSGTALSSIPSGFLPSGIIPAATFLNSTFAKTRITSIPSGFLPSGITPAASFLKSTFEYTQITSIPSGFLSGINFTSSAASFLNGTFANTNITSIPSDFLSFLSGATSVPNGFLGSSNSGCFAGTKITSIPTGFLPSTISTVGQYFLAYTFNGCTNLASIPTDLLPSGITTTASSFLLYTFQDCISLTEIPANFLSNITTGVGSNNFTGLFMGCTGITEVPANFLSNLANLGSSALSYAFYGCANLTTVNNGFLSGLTQGPGLVTMSNIFDGCVNLNYIDIFGNSTEIQTSTTMNSAFSGVASESQTKLTLRIHGKTNVLNITNAGGLVSDNVNKICVDSSLVDSYKDDSNWSALSSKIEALQQE